MLVVSRSVKATGSTNAKPTQVTAVHRKSVGWDCNELELDYNKRPSERIVTIAGFFLVSPLWLGKVLAHEDDEDPDDSNWLLVLSEFEFSIASHYIGQELYLKVPYNILTASDTVALLENFAAYACALWLGNETVPDLETIKYAYIENGEYIVFHTFSRVRRGHLFRID